MIRVWPVSAEGGLQTSGWDSHGPVDDVWVDVVDPQVLQRGLEVNPYMLGPVVRVPQLGLDEQVLPEVKHLLSLQWAYTYKGLKVDTVDVHLMSANQE